MSAPPGPASRRVAAHAKLNLVLHVLAREASGFHGLETLFQRLALHDVVTVTVGTPDCALRCDGPAMPEAGLGPPERNLAWRAAQAYVGATGWDTGWHIMIEKHIPVGGGLGGGSADAAAVLRALEELCPAPLGRERLVALAGTLGSDVPFLVLDAPRALAWGRGDRLLPLPALPAMPVTLVAFRQGVDTGQAYRALAEERATGARATDAAAVRALAYPADAFGRWDTVAALATNDFESVVPRMHAGVAAWLPRVRAIASRLRAEGAPAIGLMSGSGATCFLLSTDATAATAAAALAEGLSAAPRAASTADAAVRLVHTRTIGPEPPFP